MNSFKKNVWGTLSECIQATPHTVTEIKSHRIWPIWKQIPIRFSNVTEFSDHLKTFYKEIIINHTLLYLSQASAIKIKCFWLQRGVPKWFLSRTQYKRTGHWRKYKVMLLRLYFSDIAQSVTCLATDASLTADPGVASSIPARSHTFMEIDHEIISTVILLPSAESFKKGCCQLQAKVCARSTG